MTDKSFEISVDAIHANTSGDLLAEVQRQLVQGLVDREEKEMDQLINGRWPDPEPPVYEEPIAPRSPQEDNVGLFQQGHTSWGATPELNNGDKERLRRLFADKLNTHAPEPKPETQVVPRRNGKPTAAAKVAGQKGLSKQAVSGIAAASAHTHSIGGGMMQQGKLQAGALNIGGRDVKECLDCGALVLDDVAHRKQHTMARNETLNLERQLADAREEIRELKKARTKKVPRPKKTTADELRGLQAEARALGAMTPDARNKALQEIADGKNPRMFRHEVETYGPTDILQPRSFVDMKMHGPGEL